MKTEQKEYYLKLIQQMLIKLSEDIEKLRELSKPISPDNAIGRVSRMEAINDKSVNDAAIEKLKLRQLQLKEAEQRVEFDEKYGVCLNCELEIASKRMDLFPESRLCVDCLNERE